MIYKRVQDSQDLLCTMFDMHLYVQTYLLPQMKHVP